MELLIPFGTEYIEDGEYAGCEAERIILPGSLLGIGSEAFANSPNLRELILPDSLTQLGAACFLGCGALETVGLPRSLRTIGEGVFVECGALKSVCFPDGLLRIEAMAFQSSGLQSVTVPESVEYIGENAFWECEALREANVLGRDTVIEENAFGCCYELTRGYIAPGCAGVCSPPEELLYTLLWCSCPERHREAESRRARDYIQRNEPLIMERIFKYNNVAAMTGLATQRLIKPESINAYVRQAAGLGLTEITALLLKCRGGAGIQDGEFEL